MAQLEDISITHWVADRDVYRLPNGREIDGWRVRAAKKAAADRRDAARGYDPYNHFGRFV